MPLIPWEHKRRELEPFRDLREEVDRLFDDFFRGWGRPYWAGRGPVPSGERFLPSVNLKENERELMVTAEVPGLSRDELEVTISEDTVTLKGERREDNEVKEEDYHYKETAYGAFERVIPLPAQIKAKEARAKLKDGVLTLTLPKIQGAKRKQVRVKVE